MLVTKYDDALLIIIILFTRFSTCSLCTRKANDLIFSCVAKIGHLTTVAEFSTVLQLHCFIFQIST